MQPVGPVAIEVQDRRMVAVLAPLQAPCRPLGPTHFCDQAGGGLGQRADPAGRRSLVARQGLVLVVDHHVLAALREVGDDPIGGRLVEGELPPRLALGVVVLAVAHQEELGRRRGRRGLGGAVGELDRNQRQRVGAAGIENQDGLVCVHINAPGVNWNGVKIFYPQPLDNGKKRRRVVGMAVVLLPRYAGRSPRETRVGSRATFS